MSSRSSFFFLLAACVLVAFALVIATPTLSFDDLMAAKSLPARLSNDGFLHASWWAFMLPDVGQTEMRTYGLTRFIQIFTASMFGSSTALTMGFVIIVHAASGILVYRLVKLAIGDTTIAALLMIAWVASPAVIPTIRTEHHWLYLIAPYYSLIAWVLLNEAKERSVARFCLGAILLTSVWLLGEAPVLPLLLVAALWILTSPNWRSASYVFGQAAISIGLLASFLSYLRIFVNDPSQPHRFVIRELAENPLGGFLSKIWEAAKGIAGLPYVEVDLGMPIPSFHVADSWEVWTLMGILVAAWTLTLRSDADSSTVRPSMKLIGSIWLMWIGSLGVYFCLNIFRATVFPMRYATAFFLFTPLALALGVAVISRGITNVSRSAAAVAACFAVAFSTVLSLKYEYAISAPNRSYMADLRGLGVIVHAPDAPGFTKGVAPNPAFPGIVPITSPGYGDSKKSFWTLSPMLELYADAVAGSECRFTKDGNVEVLQGPNIMGVKPPSQIKIIGTDKGLSEICDTP